MSRKKAGVQDNWTKEETQKFLHKKAKQAELKCKKQEQENIKNGVKYERIPILHGFKMVPVKDKK